MHGRVSVKILSAALCSILFSAVSGKAPAADASQENCIVTGACAWKKAARASLTAYR